MEHTSSGHELHHEIFGSILDRIEMTPFLLLPAGNYDTALKQATKMMGNRGFDTAGNELQESERERAEKYIAQAYKYFFNWMFPFFRNQMERLAALNSANAGLYRDCLEAIGRVEAILESAEFRPNGSRPPVPFLRWAI
jgi:hypothetical protein